MRTVNLCATALFVGLLLPIGSAFGQHDWERTITVDPILGAADHQKIQDAIDDMKIGLDPTDRYTVLIFAGTYTENVTLDDLKENVDLVGIDRDSVIIAPSSGKGIVITSGTETSRNNRIANLTIITTTGHGIEIVKGGTPAPKDITIEGVTIQANGFANGLPEDGIYASEVQNLRIADVDITTTTGHGIEIVKDTLVPKDITIEGVTIHADGSGMEGVTGKDATNVSLLNCDITSNAGNGIEVGDDWTLTQVIVVTTEDANLDQDGIVLDHKNNVTIIDSDISGEAQALRCFGFTNALVVGCRLFTPGSGGAGQATVYFAGSSTGFVFQNCLIISDATASINDRPTPHGVFTDAIGVHDVVFQSCTISAVGDDVSLEAVAVQSDVPGTMRFVGCDLSATNIPDAGDPSASAKAVGVRTNVWPGAKVVLIGGSITTSSTKCKETEVWDLEGVAVNGPIEVFGTDLSKWKGPIHSAGRPRSVIQRTIDVVLPDDDVVRAAFTLAASEQPITTGITDPDVYRVLSVTGNESDMDQDVYIIGTDWADNAITDKITLTGTTPAKGLKPFKTVTTIIFPALKNAGQTVTVGTTNKLGLYYPIASISDVLQQGRKESAATSYKLEDIVLTNIDAIYSTVDVTATITDGDSFEWAILASQ